MGRSDRRVGNAHRRTPANALLRSGAPQPTWLDPATFAVSPGVYDYNNAGNWSTVAVPGTNDTATFGVSATTSIAITTASQVDGWLFTPGASAYTFTQGSIFDFNGGGIVVNGGSVSIANVGIINFNGTSSAGRASITSNGALNFNDSSTAGSATITNNSQLDFNDFSTAGNAQITNNVTMGFHEVFGVGASTAENSTITNNGNLTFFSTSTAASANITNNFNLAFRDNCPE